MDGRIADMGPAELSDLARSGSLHEPEALQVLRNPYCTLEIAELITADRRLLTSFKVRELLAGFRGMPMARAMHMVSTLPWLSLLELARSPGTPPAVRRNAEQKLLNRLEQMALGERVALARQAPRPLIKKLIDTAETVVLVAMLNNPRLVENDILLMLNTITPPAELLQELTRHQKWGQYYGVRLALAQCPHTPVPLALSAMVQLRRVDLRAMLQRPGLHATVKEAAEGLLERKARGRRRQAGS